MKYILLILFAFIQLYTSAQSASDLFAYAKQSYESGNNAQAIEYLNQCEQRLGKTNPKIESLRAWCYYNMQDWVHAAVALESYFKVTPSANYGSTAHNDLVALKVKVDAELQVADKEFVEKRDETRMEKADQYVEQQNRDLEAQYKRAKIESERKLYPLYIQSEDPQELQSYLDMFPESTHAKEIKFRKYDVMGDQDVANKNWYDAIQNYENALKLKSDYSVQQKLYNAKDERTYELAIQSNTVFAFESYLTNFPGGNHKDDAQSILLEHYLVSAKNDQKEYNHAGVKQNLDICYDRFRSTNAWNSYKTDYYATLQSEGISLTTGKKKKRMSYISYAIHYYEQLSAQDYSQYHRKLAHLKRRKKAWSRPTCLVFAYRRSVYNNLGFDFGCHYNQGIGWFISGYGTGQTLLDMLPHEPFEYTGRDFSQFFANFNLTKKVLYPVWIYAGAGYAHYTRYETHPYYTDKIYLPEGDDARMGQAVNIEAGLLVITNPFTFSAGLSMPQFSQAAKQELELDSFPMVVNFSLGIRIPQ